MLHAGAGGQIILHGLALAELLILLYITIMVLMWAE